MQARTILCAIVAAVAAPANGQNAFSESERREITRTWTESVSSYVGTPPYADNRGSWQVRPTPEGSTWLYEFNRRRGIGKGAKAVEIEVSDDRAKEWNTWIAKRMASDHYAASQEAADLNLRKTPRRELDLGSVDGFVNRVTASPVGERAKRASTGEPEEPGQMPTDLKAAFGAPPRFAAAVRPQLYKIKFDDEPSIDLVDNVRIPNHYAYYRFAKGVLSGGKPIRSMSDEEVRPLLKRAGIGDSEWRVMRAVSQLEGGFDSINTYDTGYLSVGFIQFATGSVGAGSLGKVLNRMKADDPKAFERDFRRYGIDVDSKNFLVVWDTEQKLELAGKQAVLHFIESKRLTAVFVRAGRKSAAFQAAQLVVAREKYLPDEDKITASIGDKETEVKVSEIIKSEAGMATLMDRKVHTGRLGQLSTVVERIAKENEVDSIEELASYEDLIVSAMRYRRDFTKDASLEQPVASSKKSIDLESRGSERGTRPKSGAKRS